MTKRVFRRQHRAFFISYLAFFILLVASSFWLFSSTREGPGTKKHLIVAYESLPHSFDGAERYLAAVVRAFSNMEGVATTFVYRSNTGKCAATAVDANTLDGTGVRVIEATPSSETFAHLMTLPNTALLLPLSFFASCGGAGVNASSESYSAALLALKESAECRSSSNTRGAAAAAAAGICATRLFIFDFDAQADRARGLALFEPYPEQAKRYAADEAVLEARELNLFARADVLAMMTAEDLAAAPATREGVPRMVIDFRDDMPPHLNTRGTPAARAASSAALLPRWAERSGFVFVGSGNSGTNQVAIWSFLKNVWPKVRAALPEATLYVVGPQPNALCKAFKIWCSWLGPLSADPHAAGVVVEGLVDDLDAFLSRMRVAVAPMVTGTGVNTKTGLFLARGVPVVGTVKAARGYGLPPYGVGLLVQNDMGADYAATLVQLYTREDAWAAASLAGLQLSARLDEQRQKAQDIRDVTALLFLNK